MLIALNSSIKLSITKMKKYDIMVIINLEFHGGQYEKHTII